MHYRNHRFRAGETIDAVVRLLGRHDYTGAELAVMRVRFNALNGARVPRQGDTCRIPVVHTTVDDFGDLVVFPLECEPYPADEG